MLRLPLACGLSLFGLVLVVGLAHAQSEDNPPSGERGHRMPPEWGRDDGSRRRVARLVAFGAGPEGIEPFRRAEGEAEGTGKGNDAGQTARGASPDARGAPRENGEATEEAGGNSQAGANGSAQANWPASAGRGRARQPGSGQIARHHRRPARKAQNAPRRGRGEEAEAARIGQKPPARGTRAKFAENPREDPQNPEGTDGQVPRSAHGGTAREV